MSYLPMINYRKDAKKATKFTFMVCGESGTGKTTFINCLLNKKVMNHRYEEATGDTKTLSFTSTKSVPLPNTSILTKHEFNPRTASEEPGIALTETQVEMVDDDNQRLLLTVIDTPGFGDNLNNELCFIEIENYLKQQFDLVLAEETRIKRNPRFVDTRVHVLLYFITPTGHGLREIDIVCMKRLSKYVNILPIISKADSFTESELKWFKTQIKIDIEKFNVPVFQFDSYLDEYDPQEDYDIIQECKYLAELNPFAIITSEDDYEIKDKNGDIKLIRARKYPWGLVDISNAKYSDFTILRNVLLGSHLQDLKDLTHDFLYETYRTERLTNVTGKDDDDYEDEEFQDSFEHQNINTNNNYNPSKSNKNNAEMPSMSNLAELTSASSPDQKAMNNSDRDNHTLPSPKLKDNASFTSSTSTIENDNDGHSTSNQSFKRLSIAPQRHQLRQISETVPYVIRHERILERQQKLEEMEMSSAKELANRAAALEAKAQELKMKEKKLLRRLDMERSRKSSQQSPRLNEHEFAAPDKEQADNDHVNEESEDVENEQESQNYEKLDNDEHYYHNKTIAKDETITDLNSVIRS